MKLLNKAKVLMPRPIEVVAWIIVLSLVAVSPAIAVDFSFSFKTGDSYRILSQVRQDVYVDGVFSHVGDQLNRIVVKVGEVKDGKAFHQLEYSNSAEARNPNQVYQFDRRYSATFWRDKRGNYQIDPNLFVPTVQDVPVFPNRDLKPGDTWSAPGREIHDMREGLGMAKPLVFPMPVSYLYEGKATWEGKEYDLLRIDYNVYYRPEQADRQTSPVSLITGFSRQRMFWDTSAGRPVYYDEQYAINLQLTDGRRVSFEGTANARVLVESNLEIEKGIEQLRQDLRKNKVENVSVRETEHGITIAIENIQFAPDSAQLLPGEIRKLETISGLLARWPDKDLLISGHTALAGNEQGRQKLSEERAQTVGQYLLDQGVRKRDQVVFEGRAASQPLAENTTEAGRSRNRRVEITILK